MTDKEMKGLELFKGKAICNNCHIADLGPDAQVSHPKIESNSRHPGAFQNLADFWS
ncbi:MAG: hypothetical protein WA130_10590 [Candidatus Methanoperedens sp.]